MFTCSGLKVAAMFKIGNSKDLPAIPDHLSDEGKDFVRQCLQRNPLHRPTAAQLLEHPFVKNAAPLERPILSPETSDPPPGVTNGVKSLVFYLFLLSFLYLLWLNFWHAMIPSCLNNHKLLLFILTIEHISSRLFIFQI